MKIIERIHNVATGEILDIERNETSEEKQLREQLESEAQIKIAEDIAKKRARQEILDRLGLTEEEAAVLLG